MEYVLIEIGSDEWNYMWDWVKNHPLNEGLEKPGVALNDGMVWEYMGSFFHDGKLLHDFKHRCHPTTKKREYLTLNGSKNFTEEQIKKRFKI